MLLQKSRIYQSEIFKFERKSLCKKEEEKKLENEEYFIERVIETENKKILLFFILPAKSNFIQRIFGKTQPSIIRKKSLTVRFLAEKGDLLGVKIMHKICGDDLCTGYGYSIESNNTELIDYCREVSNKRKFKCALDTAPLLYVYKRCNKSIWLYLTTIYDFESVYEP